MIAKTNWVTLSLCRPAIPKKGILANSVDPALFTETKNQRKKYHQRMQVFVKKYFSEKEKQYFWGNYDLYIYTMNHPDFIVCSFTI